ncbi:ATPase, partial [Streptomyces massasporeus]
AVLASFAPRVAACADEDPVAAGILRAAARHMADSAAAVCPSGGASCIAVTGGLFKLGEPLLGPLDEELKRRLPQVQRVPAEGDPLHGSVRMAAELSSGSLMLPSDGTMLSVTTRSGD